MKRHHHIDPINAFIRSNIPLTESQLLIAVFFCQHAAFFNDILFQIQSDDPYIVLLQFMQIIIHRKRKIRLSTSKIQDCHFPVSGKFGKDILNKLQKTIDLSEFVITTVYNLPLRSHNSQVDQKFYRFSLFQNVPLLPIMRQRFHADRFVAKITFLFFLFFLNCEFSLLT